MTHANKKNNLHFQEGNKKNVRLSHELDVNRKKVQEIFAQIVQRAPEHKIQPSLDRVVDALDILGNPQLAYPVVHVAGTNGKTSTSRMIDSLMTAWGTKTGRFTSPHLCVPNERISIAGEPITDETFIYAYEDVLPYIKMADENSLKKQGPRLSFFELLTVMAYAYYADAPVDVAIMEIGMGGLWDCTNVVDAAGSVITPISIDHTKWLGSTLSEIATQKAGIIKENQIVIVGRQDPEAEKVIREKIEKVSAKAYFMDKDMKILDRKIAVGGQLLTMQTPFGIYENVFLPLHGEYQAENALLALCATEAFYGSKTIDAKVVESGFLNASSPGRLEIVRTSPTVVVDATHNPGGAKVLSQAVCEIFPQAYITGIFSAMADKDVESILLEMEKVVAQIVLVQMSSDRGMDIKELEKIAVNVFGEERVHIATDLLDAIDKATAISDTNAQCMAGSVILSFGSVYLAGEIRRMFKK